MLFFREELEKYLHLEKISNVAIAKAFNNLGYEVEKISPINFARGLKFAKVLSCEKHPNADTLSFCKLQVENKTYSVVCGGKNIAKDQIVVYAPLGSTVKNTILKTKKIRGINSEGMILSLSEILGVDDYLAPSGEEENIFVVDTKNIKNFDINSFPMNYFNLNLNDVIFDITILNDRQYASSYLNITKELGAYLGIDLKKVFAKTPPVFLQKEINISLELKENAVKLNAVPVKLSSKGKTPQEVITFLMLNNIKVENNLNDLIAYFKLIQGLSMVVLDKTKKVTLNNEYINDVNIFVDSPLQNKGDEVLFVAFASEEKRSVLSIENINETFGIINSKGTGFSNCNLNPLINLAIECNYIEYIGFPHEKINQEFENRFIEYDEFNLKKFIGQPIDFRTVQNYLIKLDIILSSNKVYIPEYRIDIVHWQDLVEEIIRFFNINKLNEEKIEIDTENNDIDNLLDDKAKTIFLITNFLTKLSFNEIKTYHLDKKASVEKFNIFESKKLYSLREEYHQDVNTFQTSLMNGLLNTHTYNYRKDYSGIYLFEMNNVYKNKDNNLHLGVIYDDTYPVENKDNLVLIGKEIIFNIFMLLKEIKADINWKKVSFKKNEDFLFNPYLSAKIYYHNKLIGIIGEIHPRILREKKYIRLDKIKSKLYYFEINISYLL